MGVTLILVLIRLREALERGLVFERGDVAGDALAAGDFAQQAAHDFA